MTDRKYQLGHQKIGRLLLRYSAPAMVAMLTHSLYNVVDAGFVGHGAGTDALAGLAVAFPIQMFILAIAQLVGIGSASIISRSLGAGDHRKAERTAGASFVTVGVLSVILTATGLAFLEPVLRLFGATPAVLPYAADYLSVILMGSFFFAFNVSSNNVVRSEGNAKAAMISMFIGAGTNIVLDPIFIFGLGMGIRGAAVATVIANACVFTYLCAYFLGGKSMLRIRVSDLKPDLRRLPEVFAIGSASFVRVCAGSLMAIVLNNSIKYYGSDVHLAILGVSNRAVLFMLLPLFGLVQGLQPIVGFNYGAGNIQRVKESVGKAIAAATAIASAGFVVMMLFPGHILAMFSPDPELLREGVPILRITILWVPFVGIQIIGASVFQALGKAGPALILSMSRQVLFFIPLVLVLPRYMGLIGIWSTFPLADCLSTVLTAAWLLAAVRHLDRHPFQGSTDPLEPPIEIAGD
jgi:MATE family, multidrug efflux pump